MVRLAAIALVLLSSLAGCKDKELAALETTRDEVCACKTVACGEAAMKKVPQEKIETNRKLQLVASKMLDCMSKLYDAQRPSTDPDAETPEPASSATSPGSADPASARTP